MHQPTEDILGMAGRADEWNAFILSEEISVVYHYCTIGHVFFRDLLILLSLVGRSHQFCQIVHVDAYTLHWFQQPPDDSPYLVLEILALIWLIFAYGSLHCYQVKSLS